MYAIKNLSISRAILAATALTIAFGLAGCKSSAPATDDAGLTAALQTRIAGDSALSNEPIQSSVQKQVATLNGTVMQSSNTSMLIFSIPRLIEYCSTIFDLVPGDVIATGTPAGVGFTRKPPIFLKPGDVVEVEIENIGVLRNPVVDE